MLHVDDPLCIGEAKLADNLFTALGQRLTTKITEVIGPKPIEFLGTRVWRTLQAFREMQKAGYLGSRSRMTHLVTRSRRRRFGRSGTQHVSSCSGQGAIHPSPKTRLTLCNQEMLEETGASDEHRREEARGIGHVATPPGRGVSGLTLAQRSSTHREEWASRALPVVSPCGWALCGRRSHVR